jgi:Tol biopolymer transport system component
VWTPDGKHLLFSGRDQFDSDWWVIPFDGGRAVKTEVSSALGRVGMTSRFFYLPGAWPAGSNPVFFSGQVESASNIWQIPISPRTWHVAGTPQRVTFGTATESAPTVSAAGTLAFAATNLTSAIWSLPADGNRAKVTGDMRLVTQGAALNYSPALTADGRKMVFASNRGGHLDVWTKDLEGGTEASVTSSPVDKANPKISPDASRIAYNVGIKVYLASTARGGEEMISEDCGSLLDWSPDGRYLLCLVHGSKTYTGLLNISSRRKTALLKHSLDGISAASFSPDMRWIAFTERKGPSVTTVMVSPLHGETAAPENEWITVSGLGRLGTWHDKVEWSPDGSLLYFTSDQDGFRCIWAQPLDPRTKRPAGPVIPVYHFHEARRSLANVGLGQMELCVMRDRIIFNLGDRTGNIWMSRPEK